MHTLPRLLTAATAFIVCQSASAQDPLPPTSVGDMLLHPSTIRITGHLEAPDHAGAEQLAVRYFADRLEQKLAEENAAAQLPSFWRASFWKYLPKSTGTMNSSVVRDDDSFSTPAELTLAGRLLEREVEISDRQTALLFAK